MANPYDVTDSSNLESLFSNLNQVTMRESRGGGGTGGGSLPIEGNMDSNPLIAHNPYLGKNVTSFDDGGVVDTTESLPMDSLLNRQIYKESAFVPTAESDAGAVGLTQIMPDTFKFFQDKGWVPEGKKFSDLKTDTALATDLQQKYMTDLLSRKWNKGNDQVKRAKALAAYNMGPTKLVDKLNELKKKGVDIYNDLDWVNELSTETSDYVNKILLGGDANFEAGYTTEYNKTGKNYNEGGEFEYSVDPYEDPVFSFNNAWVAEKDRIDEIRRKEWYEHVGLNPYHVSFSSADKSDYRKLYEAEQERRKEASTKWTMRENYDMQGSYKEDPEYIKWKEGSDNPANLTNPWEEGYDDWYKPRATADSEGDTKPSSGSGGGRTTPSAARRNKNDVLSQIISSNQVASQEKSKAKSGTMDLAHWSGDKPNPYLTLNIQEETDYAAQGMKMPKYNQGGHYTQQANEAVAANQLSNILMNSSSLSSGIMPMAKYDKGGKIVPPWENQDWIDSKDFENWGGLPNPPLTPMQQHMNNVMLDPNYTPPSDFNIDFSPKTRSNPMAETMAAILRGEETDFRLPTQTNFGFSGSAPSFWDIPTDGETKDNKKKAKLSGGSSNNRLSTSRNKKQNRINNIILANQQAQKRKSGSRQMDLAHWSGDKPNPFLTLNVQSETDYANKGMKMNNLSNKERLQNLLKAVPNEAAFNKLSKIDQENFTKSWIRLGGVKKRKFTQGGRF